MTTESAMETAAAAELTKVATRKPEPRSRLIHLSNAQWHLDRAIKASVREGRADGMTWAQIGLALGVTAQAAQQRYGR